MPVVRCVVVVCSSDAAFLFDMYVCLHFLFFYSIISAQVNEDKSPPVTMTKTELKSGAGLQGKDDCTAEITTVVIVVL